jgi:Reverse transcriptase (RNA-dependent DNA polymerase)/RNase H-like domain found in reverse transcriptase
MPHLESELSGLSGSKCFSTFDLSNGYWQLQLDEASQECQSFITPDGIYSPTRVLHGTRNAVSHMQSSLQGILHPLKGQLLAWLDDLLLHAADEASLLCHLRMLFQICQDADIKLHPGKCELFAREVRWCGRLISGSGVRFDPRRVQGLRKMELPTTGADLQQFLCAMNWMPTAVPNYSSMISPLHSLLEEVYRTVGGKRTKSAVSKILLSAVGWTAGHSVCFRTCQEALEYVVTLAHVSQTKRVCLYTDASTSFWSSITTQVPPEDLALPLAEQRHEPLAFMSGAFTGAPGRWSIIEKEAFAILASCERLD